MQGLSRPLSHLSDEALQLVAIPVGWAAAGLGRLMSHPPASSLRAAAEKAIPKSSKVTKRKLLLRICVRTSSWPRTTKPGRIWNSNPHLLAEETRLG